MLGISPFVPLNKSSIAIVDGRVSKEIVDNLKINKLDVMLTCKCEELYDAISYHPDIVIHPINRKTLIIAPNVYEYYREIFKNKGINLIKGEKKLQRNYPDNVAYNVARVGRYAIHNFRYTDEKLKFYLLKEGAEFIDVKQGYSKCSVSIINNNAIITSDPLIYKKCIEKSIDTLLIDSGFIMLPGLNYGFIGGATGLLSPNELLITGNLDTHPNRAQIKFFMEKHGVFPIFLSTKEIIDLGSIITL